MAITILLVDDHRSFREAMLSLLDGEPDVMVVAEADDGENAIQLAAELAPDIVLMDIMLPGMSGIDATSEIIAAHPECLVVMVSLQTNPLLVTQSFAAGAAGYVSKGTAGADLLDAVRAVAAGGTFLSPGLAGA